MPRRDVLVGIVVLSALAGLIYFWQRPETSEDLQVPQTLSVEDEMEQKFNLQIPENADRAELSDVAGGSASGIATRVFEDGTFTHTVLADLPEPEGGKFYEGWLVKDADVVYTGKMKLAKGGYLLEFSSNENYSEHNRVVITLEEVDDASPEEHVLEGSF